MKNKFILLLIILSLNTFAGGERGSGARGGGHVIEVNGKKELVDLVTSATCEWKYGQELIQENSYLRGVLNKLANIDWYFANELRGEIEYLSWCFTGALYDVPAHDDESFVRQLSQGVQQAAFRYGPTAYIDQSIFNQLSERSAAFLIIHEVMHSYLPMTLEMRQFKLMSLVRTISRVDSGNIQTRKQLYINFDQNHIDFPLNTDRLDQYQEVIEFLTSNKSEQAAMLNEIDVDRLITTNTKNFKTYLAYHDQGLITTGLKAMEDLTKYILINGTDAQITKLIQAQYENFSPRFVAYQVYEELSTTHKESLKELTSASEIVQELESIISSVEFEIENNRLVASESIALLTSSKARIVSSLKPIKSSEDIPYQLKALINIIVQLAKVDEKAELTRIFLGTSFTQSIGLIDLQKKIKLIQTPIKREQAIALEVVSDLARGLRNLISYQLSQKLNKETYNKITKLLKL